MTQEDKELLLKDLCARLPYGIKASYYGAEEECETWDEIEGITLDEDFGGYVDIGQYSLPIERIKPYLFPLSSMTEEQKKEYGKACDLDTEILEKHPMDGTTPFPALYNSQDWLNKNHFDIYGLIPMGVALDATNLKIY